MVAKSKKKSLLLYVCVVCENVFTNFKLMPFSGITCPRPSPGPGTSTKHFFFVRTKQSCDHVRLQCTFDAVRDRQASPNFFQRRTHDSVSRTHHFFFKKAIFLKVHMELALGIFLIQFLLDPFCNELIERNERRRRGQMPNIFFKFYFLSSNLSKPEFNEIFEIRLFPGVAGTPTFCANFVEQKKKK